MQFQIERARNLYEEAWQGIAMLERDGQLAIGASAVFYNGILEDIEKHDYDVFNRRARLSSWEKVRRIPSLWLKVRSL
jgi:phytoene synthase